MNYIESLTASGCSVTSLEHFTVQQNRFRRSALKQRMSALIGSARPPDQPEARGTQGNAEGFSDWEKAVGLDLQTGLTAFLQSEDQTGERWATLLSETFAEAWPSHLEAVTSDWYLTRQDFPVAEEEDLAAAIKETICNADDVRVAFLQAAVSDPAATLALTNVVTIVRQLTQRATDAIERRLVERRASTPE